jgi:hypothetical protein
MDGHSHIESWRCAHAAVREGGGLPSVRRHPAGNARPIADADLCVVVDAEPVAPAALAGARGRIGALHAAFDDHARSPLAGAPGIWGSWVTLTRVAINRSLWRAMSTCEWSRGMLSAMRYVPNLFCVPSNGDGRVCGVACTARRRSARCWQRGPSGGRRTGSSGSIGPTTRVSWSRSAKACTEGAPLVGRSGKSRSRNDWTSIRPIVPLVDRRRWTVWNPVRRSARKPTTKLTAQDLSCILPCWLPYRFWPWRGSQRLLLGATKQPSLPIPDPSRFSVPLFCSCPAFLFSTNGGFGVAHDIEYS